MRRLQKKSLGLVQVSSGSVRKEAIYTTEVQSEETRTAMEDALDLAKAFEESGYIKHQTPGDSLRLKMMTSVAPMTRAKSFTGFKGSETDSLLLKTSDGW